MVVAVGLRQDRRDLGHDRVDLVLEQKPARRRERRRARQSSEVGDRRPSCPQQVRLSFRVLIGQRSKPHASAAENPAWPAGADAATRAATVAITAASATSTTRRLGFPDTT
jgi:hypothetical protein